jgi:hypothetical protein
MNVVTGFHDIPAFFQANATMLPRLGRDRFSKFCTLHIASTTLTFITAGFEFMRASKNTQTTQ